MNEKLTQKKLSEISDFFNNNKTLINSTKVKLPGISNYIWPKATKRLKNKTGVLNASVKYVEKTARKECASDFEKTKEYIIDYKHELNEAQFRAVTKIKGPVLVIAGAGSGKTRAIVYRVSFLLENNILANRILLLTFTRKAAKEMLDRVIKLNKNRSSGAVVGGTFHSFANMILRRFGRIIGISSNFTIIDASDSADAINLVRLALGIKKSKNTLFPNKNQLQAIISTAHNKSVSIKRLLKDEHPRFLKHKGKIQEIAAAYSKYKRLANIFDYDDLLEILRDKLIDNKDFRIKVQSLFDYILVDEYQDTNIIQGQLLKLLADNHKNIFVVGDDAQSIYAFRGAHFENILKFPVDFSKCTVILMEDNYRSNQEILNFSNAVINHAFLGYKKHLQAQRSVGYLPQALIFADEQEEAAFVADRIEEQHKNGLKLNNMAVLYRASYQGNFVQAELLKRNIPFITVGGIKFIERKHVKDVMAYLRVSINSHDSIAWSRILTLLSGIGDVISGKIIREIYEKRFKIENHLNKKYTRQLVKLLDLIIIVRKLTSPKEKLDAIFKYYFPYLRATEEDAEVRQLDLQVLSKLAETYKTTNSFIDDFALEPPSQAFQDKKITVSEPISDYITLSTVHSAKGLEWNTVFIVHCLDGLFPSYRSLYTVDDLDEERRLFYVATTRAKEKLFVTMPSYSAGYDAYFARPSRFIIEALQDGHVIDFNIANNKELHTI